MGTRYWVIDEVSLSMLGSFETQEEAVDFVAKLLTVNDDEFLEELTISNDQGPMFSGDSLRSALRDRAAERDRLVTSGRASVGGGFGPLAKDVVAKSPRS